MALPSLLISSLEQSGIRRVMTRAAEFPDAIHLEVGEPGFVTPRHITDAAHQAALDGFTGYTADVGLSSLRDALAQAATFYHGDETFPEEICVTVGGIGALFGGIRAVVDTDDEVLIPDPGWPNYAMVVEAAAARPVRYPLRAENHYLPDIDEIEAMLSERTHALIINSPSNPLGTVFPERLMQELVELTRRRDLWLISDEVYHRLLFEGEHNSAWRFHSGGRLIVVGSFSKTYAMTGWRVGYALAPPPVIELYAKIQEATVSNAATPSQKAAEAALLGPQDCVQAMLATYTRNREVAMEVLDQRGLEYLRPQGAFYIWVHVGREDTNTFVLELLEQKRVALAPGSTFGQEGRGWVRLSLAANVDDVREGVTRLADFLGDED